MFATPAYAQAVGGGSVIASFVPLLLFCIPFAIGNYFLAKRIEGATPAIWVVVSLIPLVNYFFFFYVAYRVVFQVLDHLKDLKQTSAF